MGRPNAKIIVQQHIDIDSACFPSLETAAPKIRLNLLDRFPYLPNLGVGFDLYYGIEKIRLILGASHRGGSVEMAEPKIAIGEQFDKHAFRIAHRFANIP